ncbi:uncharacterized protein A4U43_C02F17530 [Asparagus officinalis]|uniref:Exostosin GT47 domain-containing protein n=1 Tax=Asparagus officinalis TaxID=4686 RepID=A0A5P1FNT1_ASPOF|nr:xyloglucan-specific galacturonosyltransferase 1-like [Asparagus officinalis]ONK78341.1 uncharacterized protein A4U43_C02F17530 [Asparagus officinalis]
MAPSSFPRRRTSDPLHQAIRDQISTSSTKTKSSTLSISPTFILLLFLTIWCTSTLLSSSFHICISSPKLDLYCISGGLSHPPLPPNTSNPITLNHIDDNISKFIVMNNSTEETERGNAYKIVRERLNIIRSWASDGPTAGKSCDGRRIFVYDLPPKFNRDLLSQCNNLLPWTNLCNYFVNEGKGERISNLGPSFYRTHQYSLELIFHSRILKHPCRVLEPNNAKLFYVPFYGGLDILRWHFSNVSVETKDMLGLELVQWLEAQNSWTKNGGRDHMFVLGKISWDFRRREGDSWGSNFLMMDEMKAPYKFLIERQPWEVRDVGIPHPTHFHPKGDSDVVEWQNKIGWSGRKNLVTFAGAARPEQVESIRSLLIENCVANSDDCRFLNCSSGACSTPDKLIMSFTDSEFCLQPPGDSPTRKSVFDSLISGCIPVLFDPFTAYYQYPWHLPEDHRKYSVFIDKEEVRHGKVDVVERLKSVGYEERKEMRRFIVYELMPGLVYGDSSSEFVRFRDAFGVVMDNMMDLVTKGVR